MRAGLLVSLVRDPDLASPLISADPNWKSGTAPGALEVLERLGEAWGYVGPSTPPLTAEHMESVGGLATLSGLLAGLERKGQPATEVDKFLLPVLTTALVARAQTLLSDKAAPVPQRLLALRVASTFKADGVGPTLLELSAGTSGLEAAAARGLFRLEDSGYTLALLRGWERFPNQVKQVIQQEATSKAFGRHVLLTAIEQGILSWTDLDRHVRENLEQQNDPELRERIQALEKSSPVRSRSEVLSRFQGATELSGDAGHGERMFAERCLICHRRDDQGQRVGPELSGIRTRPISALLIDILDPSRAVTPDYTAFTLETNDGESLTGLLISKSEETIGLRLAGGEERVLARNRIKTLQASQKSLMPDGLEEGWSMQDLADLLAYLKR
jgi:putative heme-binding domain-containing protein